MSSAVQRAELQAAIWKIANEVRGAVDGWDFKQFVLGTLFYRFISENFTNFIEGGDESVQYAQLHDSAITPEIKDDATKYKFQSQYRFSGYLLGYRKFRQWLPLRNRYQRSLCRLRYYFQPPWQYR